jgi:hypothetical protein
MSSGTIFWLIILGLSSLLYFGIAIVVTIGGMADLRDLLQRGRSHEVPPGRSPGT